MPKINLKELVNNKKAEKEAIAREETRKREEGAVRLKSEADLQNSLYEARIEELAKKARPYFQEVCMPILQQVAEHLGVSLQNKKRLFGKETSQFNIIEGEANGEGKITGRLNFNIRETHNSNYFPRTHQLSNYFEISAFSDGTVHFWHTGKHRPEFQNYVTSNSQHMQALLDDVANQLVYEEFDEEHHASPADYPQM
jgi:hypothetical protein